MKTPKHMMINSLLAAALVAAVAGPLSGAALAQDAQTTSPGRPMRGMDGRGPGGMGPERMFEGLDLSEAQREQLRGMATEHRNATAPLRERMRAAQQVLADAKPGDADYDAKTAEARKTLDETRRQMRDEMAAFRTRTDAVLTPEQRAQVEQRRGEMRERMGERGEGRRGGRRQR
jgi:Spy/CpxP family protein refolding chaperone